jgi:phosphopantothenoylcysteine synthetase/decarboxylase
MMAGTLSGKKLLVTSGPTRASIDAVRYISNRSSGRLGCRIAVEALALGARLTLVAGPGSVVPTRKDLPEEEWSRLRIRRIETVPDLVETLREELSASERYHAVVHAMAVLDYVPQSEESGKIPSGKQTWTLRLTRTPKVIRHIKTWSPRTYLVAFKLEVGQSPERLREIGTAFVRDNRPDLLVANDLSRIRGDQHPAIIIGRRGKVLAEPKTKAEIARDLCRILARALA